MESGGITIGLLGPLEVRRGRDRVRVTPQRLRTLLAALAVSAGDTVSVERLITVLWGEDLPVNARRGVQTYVARLRRVLGPGMIRTTPGGYRLEAGAHQVDVLRFRRRLAEAGRARGTAAERDLLQEALALWRGTPFQGIDSTWSWATESASLSESYLGALERRIDLDLAQGRHGELAAELTELAAHHPLRETLWARLLIVLTRCGRHAEALAHYERLRRRLADELGTDPAPELRAIHASLLDPGPPSAPPARSASGRTRRRVDMVAGVCVISGTAGGDRSFVAFVWGQDPRGPHAMTRVRSR
jgi:DNA-binding SARP family transcriptional activator